MGRGRSKLSGGGAGRYRYAGLEMGTSVGNGATFKTVATVAAINAVRQDFNSSYVRRQLDEIGEGQSISLYSQYMNGTQAVPNTAENLVTWTKRGDGSWRGSNGRSRDDSDMMRELRNTNHVLAAGEVTTESHVNVTGKPGRAYGGLQYTSGTFDVMANRGEGVKKYEERGTLTSYNGTQYGVSKDASGYHVTHVQTGLSTTGTSALRTYTEVTNHIKEMDERIKGAATESTKRRFEKTIRGD